MRPRLQVCNVFLVAKECLKKEENVKINIRVTGVDIIWTSERGETVQVINLQDYKLKPLSLSGLQIQKNSISFRVQTEPLSTITGSLKSEVLPLNQSLQEYIPLPAPCVPINKPCEITCSCCGKVLTKQSTSFTRVLPLPSSGSLDISDWFCHRHTDSPNLQASVLVPKETDCFYGLCHILLKTSLLNLDSKQIVTCNRCMSWLGTCSNSIAKLWYCTISCNKNVSSSALQDFKLVVTKALKETFALTCRLILETKLSVDGSQYLLLWVIDKELDVLVGPQVSGSHTSTNLKAKKISKLLYTYRKDADDVVKSWQNDVNVQCVEIAKQMFTEGLMYLMNGTELIPGPHKMTNKYFVSYMGL